MQTMRVAIIMLALTILIYPLDIAAQTKPEQGEPLYGYYLYDQDRFTGTTSLTFESSFTSASDRSARTIVLLSYTAGAQAYFMALTFVDHDWIFADRLLYRVGDQNGSLSLWSVDRDVTSGGLVSESLFVLLSDEQYALLQTDELIEFSLRGSDGRRDVAMDDSFQIMLQRVADARLYIDAGQPVPPAVLAGFQQRN